jgi:hypothetical protein
MDQGWTKLVDDRGGNDWTSPVKLHCSLPTAAIRGHTVSSSAALAAIIIKITKMYATSAYFGPKGSDMLPKAYLLSSCIGQAPPPMCPCGQQCSLQINVMMMVTRITDPIAV